MVKVGSFFRGERYLGSLLTFPLSLFQGGKVAMTQHICDCLHSSMVGIILPPFLLQTHIYLFVCLSVCLGQSAKNTKVASAALAPVPIQRPVPDVCKGKKISFWRQKYFYFLLDCKLWRRGISPKRLKKTFNPFHFFPK